VLDFSRFSGRAAGVLEKVSAGRLAALARWAGPLPDCPTCTPLFGREWPCALRQPQEMRQQAADLGSVLVVDRERDDWGEGVPRVRNVVRPKLETDWQELLDGNPQTRPRVASMRIYRKLLRRRLHWIICGTFWTRTRRSGSGWVISQRTLRWP